MHANEFVRVPRIYVEMFVEIDCRDIQHRFVAPKETLLFSSLLFPSKKTENHESPFLLQFEFNVQPTRKASTREFDTLSIPLIYSVSYCASELNPTWPSQKAALPPPPLALHELANAL